METKEDFIRRLLLESDACKNAVELMLNCQFDEATKIFAETKLISGINLNNFMDSAKFYL